MVNVVVFILCAQIYSGNSVRDHFFQSSDEGKVYFQGRKLMELSPREQKVIDEIYFPDKKLLEFPPLAQTVCTTERGTLEPRVTLTTGTTERVTVEPSVTKVPLNENPSVTEINEYEPTMPKECANQTYCQFKNENYPEKKMEELINEYNLSNFSIREDIPEADSQPLAERILFGRYIKAPNVYNICQEEINNQIIYQAINVDKQNKYIVQGKHYQQILVMRSCKKSPLERSSKKVKFTSGVEAKCTQLETTRMLLSLSGGTIQLDRFPMPCCCTCKWHNKTKH